MRATERSPGTSAAEGRPSRAAWLAPTLVIVLAVAARAGALAVWSHNLHDDRDDYWNVAEHYVADGFWSPFHGLLNSFRPPLYPLLLAALLKMGGGDRALGFMQLVFGAITVGLTLRAGRRLGLGRMSLVAATLVALDPMLLRYTTFPMTETLCTLLVILLVNVSLTNDPPANELPASKNSIAGAAASPGWNPESCGGAGRLTRLGQLAAGAIFGVCLLCRPTIGPVAALLPLALLWRRRGNRQAMRGVVVGTAVALLGAALVIAPWAVRNWKILGWPIVTTTHGGYTLLLGNNRDFFHQVATRPVAQWWTDDEPDHFQQAWLAGLVVEMDRDIGAGDEVAMDRWMYRRAWQSIAAEPALFWRACCLRCARFWNVVPLAPARGGVSLILIGLIGAGYAVETVLFAIGLGYWARSRDERWLLPLIVILNFALIHLFYWSNMRMRSPLIPLIALFAALALRSWTARRNPKKWAQ